MINVTKYCNAIELWFCKYDNVFFNKEAQLKRIKIIILKTISSKYCFNLTCKLLDPTVNINGKG